jgi:hypothetical protein
LADPADGQYHPWFELYNPGSSALDLGGYYLSSSPTNLRQFIIPAGFSIPARGFKLVWADSLQQFNQPGGADLHADLNLQPSSTIGVFDPNAAQLDSVTIEYQAPDASTGSRLDGDLAILPLPNPTPRHSNNEIVALPPVVSANGQIVIGFNGFPFLAHRILTSTLLQVPSWSNAAGVFADGLGAFEYSVPVNQPESFYRAAFP